MYRFKSKSQISLFILIGFVILITVGFVFYLKNVDIKEEEIDESVEVPSEISPIKLYVKECIKNIAEDALILTGRQGGYYNSPQYSVNYYVYNVPYFYYLGKNLIPKKSSVQNEISNYLNNELPLCINNFEVFREQGFDINYDAIKTKTLIGEKSVIIQVKWPIDVKKDGAYHQIFDFSVSILNRLNTILNVAEEIVKEQQKDPNYVCVSCLIEFGILNKLSINIVNVEDNSLIFIISDNTSKIKGPYLFFFGIKVGESPIVEKETYGVDIFPIPDFKINIGYLFKYKLNYNGSNNVTFIDYSPLFDINESTGLISFISNKNQIGEYDVYIEAIDEKGYRDYESFKLNITWFNNDPVLDPIFDKTIKVNDNFIYYVNAVDIDNDKIYFFDDTHLFDINMTTGLINFIPIKDQEGVHIINITAEDFKGGMDTETFILTIENE